MDADPGYNSQADDQVDADMEQAQLRLEQLRKEKEEVENSRRRLEECHMRKARFMDQQNELGDRMVNAADLIGREVESLRQESNELEQIHMALTRSLKMLSTVRRMNGLLKIRTTSSARASRSLTAARKNSRMPSSSARACSIPKCSPGCAAPAKCASAPENS